VLPDLARHATHTLIATRMTTEEASSDLQKFRAPAEREVKRRAAELKVLFEQAAVRAGAVLQDAPGTPHRPSGAGRRAAAGCDRLTNPNFARVLS
jgi:hypothetical protein